MAAGKTKLKTLEMVYVAVCAALMAICSWIQIPTTVPFTLQTFGVFLAVGLLGGKLGTLSILIFILLGAVGVPVFSGFNGGIQVLLGPTGGYILGFLVGALVMWLMEKLGGKKLWFFALSCVVGLLICYAFGTAWFMVVYANQGNAVSLMTALGWCVFPFILPDIAKIALAVALSRALRRVILHNT